MKHYFGANEMQIGAKNNASSDIAVHDSKKILIADLT